MKAGIDQLFETEYGTPDVIYALHGIMSRGSEDDFDHGVKVRLSAMHCIQSATSKTDFSVVVTGQRRFNAPAAGEDTSGGRQSRQAHQIHLHIVPRCVRRPLGVFVPEALDRETGY